MGRRKLLLALAGLAVVAAAGVVVLGPSTDRISRENCDRIRHGMSLGRNSNVILDERWVGGTTHPRPH